MKHCILPANRSFLRSVKPGTAPNVERFDPLPDNFDEFLQATPFLETCFVDKCHSEDNQQLSFKYFVKSFSVLKLLEKVPQMQTTIPRETP